MDSVGGNHQRLARAHDHRVSSFLDHVFKSSLKDVDDLLARMLVPDRGNVRTDFDSVLNHHAARSAEVLLLKVGAVDSRYLLCGIRHVKTSPVGNPCPKRT